jgi:hypothetical protein
MVGNNAWNQEVQVWIERNYSGLLESGYIITSPDTIDYNCVAWAAENQMSWWWPDALGQEYWPPQAPREETLEAFIFAFSTIGYQPCETSALEIGCQKIAIYTNNQNIPTHVARQLENGLWTSKLGSAEDIQHNNLQGLEGTPGYGQIAVILKRLDPESL